MGSNHWPCLSGAGPDPLFVSLSLRIRGLGHRHLCRLFQAGATSCPSKKSSPSPNVDPDRQPPSPPIPPTTVAPRGNHLVLDVLAWSPGNKARGCVRCLICPIALPIPSCFSLDSRITPHHLSDPHTHLSTPNLHLTVHCPPFVSGLLIISMCASAIPLAAKSLV